MKKPIKLSVIIPIYNCDKYISRLIDSILRQDYDNYEIILMNDGSTDETKEILDKIKNEKFTIVHKNNTGVSDTRNQALKMITGDLITFIDSDDYISDNYFSTIMQIYNENNEPDLINFGFYSEVEDEKFKVLSSDEIKYKNVYYKNKEELNKDLVELWDNTMLYNIWNKVYKTKIIKDNNLTFIKENWGEDVIFNKEYLMLTNTMYNSEYCFYHYIRERKNALTKKFKSNFFEIRKKEFFEYNEYFQKLDIPKNKYYEFSCRRFIERVLGCFENIYNSDMSFKEKYKMFKKIMNDTTVNEALKNAKLKSKKVKILVLPIKMKLVLIEMILIKIIHYIKNKNPEIFNKLKNRR